MLILKSLIFPLKCRVSYPLSIFQGARGRLRLRGARRDGLPAGPPPSAATPHRLPRGEARPHSPRRAVLLGIPGMHSALLKGKGIFTNQ